MKQQMKNECSNQWAGTNTSLTSKTGVKQKDATNNQWTSTLKVCPECYGENCHPEKHGKKHNK